jgi:hypothetical protein
MIEITRDPEAVATELAGKLSARTRHVSVLLGAGASHSAGLPDLRGLQDVVKKSDCLTEAQQEQVAKLFKTKNLEEVLSHLRRLITVLEDGQSVGDFTWTSANELHKAMTSAIIPALDHTACNLEPFRHFASWVSGAYYRLPVEIFTINYDLLLELGFEELAVPYFDGFVGVISGQFRPELVDTIDPTEQVQVLPSTFVRLWKLHGSVNWEEMTDGTRHRIVRRGVPATGGATAAIYPSDEKYDQSRRVPFVVLMDRFRRSLAVPETVTLVAGYSFGDQHLNEMLFDAARGHPRSETVIFFFKDIPDFVGDVAGTTRNISVLGRTEAIIGGQRLKWARSEDLPGVWESAAFQLGDFKYLARFLATKTKLGDLSA